MAERKLGKHQRQHVVSKLLSENAVASQVQLVDLLAAENVVATQATVSRDLEELGAVKVRVGGGDTIYAVPELPVDHHAPADHLRRVLGDWVVEFARSGDLVVLRTPPGSAHVVASAIDRTGVNHVIGTVAGDDTILLIAGEGNGAAVASNIAELAGI